MSNTGRFIVSNYIYIYAFRDVIGFCNTNNVGEILLDFGMADYFIGDRHIKLFIEYEVPHPLRIGLTTESQ